MIPGCLTYNSKARTLQTEQPKKVHERKFKMAHMVFKEQNMKLGHHSKFSMMDESEHINSDSRIPPDSSKEEAKESKWSSHVEPEVREDLSSIERKAEEVATLIENAKHATVFVGAGLSASAGRGPANARHPDLPWGERDLDYGLVWYRLLHC